MNSNRADRVGPEAADVEPQLRPYRVFARVMLVQVITLWLLWLLQSTFGRG